MNYYASTPSAANVDIFQPSTVDIFQTQAVDIFQPEVLDIFAQGGIPTTDIFNATSSAPSSDAQVNIFSAESAESTISDHFENLTNSLLNDSLYNLASLVESIEVIYNEGV